MSAPVPREHDVVRRVVPVNVEHEREDDREDDPLLDADHDDDDRRDERDDELVRAEARISRMFAMSISLTPIRKTTDESTAFGRYCSGLVRNSRTIATTTAVVSCATWVWLFASSTISVLVGLPLTTKVLLSPAARLATPSPTRSVPRRTSRGT